jgi:hypothetical protein
LEADAKYRQWETLDTGEVVVLRKHVSGMARWCLGAIVIEIAYSFRNG